MKKVIVADDNESILQLLKELLEAKGFEVVTLRSGTAVLDVAQLSKPDLILLDSTLGNCNGYDIYKALKANMPTSEIPVLLMSPDYTEEAMTLLECAPWEEVIWKPFDMQHLLLRLDHLAA